METLGTAVLLTELLQFLLFHRLHVAHGNVGLALKDVLVVELVDATAFECCLLVLATHLSFSNTLLPLALAATLLVLPIVVLFANLLLPIVLVELLAAGEVAVILLLLVHPVAFALLVLDAPVATALQVFALPVVILLLVADGPLGLQTGIVDTLLVLDAHDFGNALALYLVLKQGILQYGKVLVLDQAALLQVDECFVLLLLALGFAQALLGIEHQGEGLHLVVVDEAVLVNLHQGIAEVLVGSGLVDGLLVGLYGQAVAELAGALQVVKFLLGAVEFTLYTAETLELGIAVGNLQHLGTLDAMELHVDDLLDLGLECSDYLHGKACLLVIDIAQCLAKEVLNATGEHLVQHVGGQRTPVGQVVGSYAVDITHLQLKRYAHLYIKDAGGDGVWSELDAAIAAYLATKGHGDIAVAHQIDRHDRSLGEAGQYTGIVQLALLYFFFVLVLLLTEDEAAYPIESALDLAYNAQLAECGFCLATFLQSLALFLLHLLLGLLYSCLYGGLLLFYRLIEEVGTRRKG